MSRSLPASLLSLNVELYSDNFAMQSLAFGLLFWPVRLLLFLSKCASLEVFLHVAVIVQCGLSQRMILLATADR